MGADVCTNPADIISVGQAKVKRKTRTAKLQLKIDKDIQFLCKSVDKETYQRVEKDIEKNGCLDPIIYWEDEDQNTIVDGHIRYEICNRLGMKFKSIPMHFETKEAVMNYVIDHQLARRNLSDIEKSCLIGMRYLTEKKASHRPSSDELHQNDGVTGETAQKIAEKNGVSQATVERDAVLAVAIDKLRKEAGDDFIKSLWAEKIKLPKKCILGLSKKSPEDMKAIVKLIENGEKLLSAEKIVQSNKAPSLDSNSNTTPVAEIDENIEKFEQWIEKALRILAKLETTTQRDKLVELSAKVQEISDKLKEIGSKNLDPASQSDDDESDDSQKEDMQVVQEGCSESIALEKDDVVAKPANGCLGSIEYDESTKLPEEYKFYEEEIANQRNEFEYKR
jgi:hypothetical protein